MGKQQKPFVVAAVAVAVVVATEIREILFHFFRENSSTVRR